MLIVAGVRAALRSHRSHNKMLFVFSGLFSLTEPLGPSRQSYVVNGSRLYLFFSSMDPDDPTALPVDMSQYIDMEDGMAAARAA